MSVKMLFFTCCRMAYAVKSVYLRFIFRNISINIQSFGSQHLELTGVLVHCCRAIILKSIDLIPPSLSPPGFE